MFTQWIIRTFRKKVAVRCLIVLEDKRIIERWAILPLVGEDITLKGIGVFKLDKNKMMLSINNVPTYVFNTRNAEPKALDLLDDEEETYLSPKNYQTALQSKALKEALDASKGGGIDSSVLILGGIMILGFLAVIYLQNQGLSSIQETLARLGIGGG